MPVIANFGSCPIWSDRILRGVNCLVFSGWNSGDGRSDFNVDVSGIVAPKIQLPDGRHIAYEEQGVSRDVAKRNILVLHGFLSCRLAGIAHFQCN